MPVISAIISGAAVGYAQAQHVTALLRRHEGKTLLVAALRLPAPGPLPDGDGGAWHGTELVLPQVAAGWRDVLSPAAAVAMDSERIALGNLLGRCPVAVLLAGA